MPELPELPEVSGTPAMPELPQFPLMSIETMESYLIHITPEQHYQRIEIEIENENENEDWNSPYITANGNKLVQRGIAFDDISSLPWARACIRTTIDACSANIAPKIFGLKVKFCDNPSPSHRKYTIYLWCEALDANSN